VDHVSAIHYFRIFGKKKHLERHLGNNSGAPLQRLHLLKLQMSREKHGEGSASGGNSEFPAHRSVQLRASFAVEE